MERTPFGETRYGALFDDREGVRKYAKHHGARSRKVGESFAQRLADLGVREGRVLDAGAGSGDTAIALAEALPQMEPARATRPSRSPRPSLRWRSSAWISPA